MTVFESFKRCRKRSVPLIVVRTADPSAALAELYPACESDKTYRWDLLRGCPEASLPPMSPDDALNEAAKLPAQSTLFMLNAHRWWNDMGAMQGVWNLRDLFKVNFRTLVLFGELGSTVPSEIAGDVIVLDHALPDADALTKLVVDMHVAAKFDPPTGDSLDRIVDAIGGTHLFGAENCLGITLNTRQKVTNGGDTIDVPALWERKRLLIEQTKGLTVDRNAMGFDQLGGIAAVKEFGAAWVDGAERPGAIVRLEEVEKMMAGTQGDLSGTAQDAHQHLLNWIEDKEIPAILLVGVPGSGKSAFSKALGVEAKVPGLAFDHGAMQGSLRGESETAIRNATAVIDAVSQGRPFIVATCNDHSSLSPEFRSRFMQTYYFDTPSREEKDAIWPIFESKYGVGGPRPSDVEWTGREIKKCCRIAHDLNWSTVKAAKRIIPISQSSHETFDRLRRVAHNVFLDASREGPYQYREAEVSGRAIDVGESLPAPPAKGMN